MGQKLFMKGWPSLIYKTMGTQDEWESDHACRQKYNDVIFVWE